MLPSGAAKVDHEALKSALDVVLNASADQGKDVREEVLDFGLRFQELDDRRVEAGQLTILVEPSRVGERSAIEDEASSVA